MAIQIITLGQQNIFKRYSVNYNIFRDLHETDLLGLELRDYEPSIIEKLKEIVIASNEICYSTRISSAKVNFLVLGSITIFKELSRKILAAGNEDLGYKISNVVNNFTQYSNGNFSINGNSYSLNQPYVMGIVNVTPDSFSDGGLYLSPENAYEHACQLIEEGADFIDIGGESTRPGSKPVGIEEELKRVIPVIEKINRSHPEVVLSIDTTKSEVAKQALENGAKIVNDISALMNDEKMASVIKDYDAGLVLMHMKGTPINMQNNPNYSDVVNEVYDFLNMQIQAATKVGIKSIIIDPGIGFGKRVEDNYEILKRLKEFKGLGSPLMIGLSRKSFIGKALNLELSERDYATLSAETIAMMSGANIIRTHNVKKTKQALEIVKFVNNPENVAHV